MTDHDHSASNDDAPTRNGTGGDDRWVRAHHLLGDAGVRLNEAHAHLATLQSTAHDDSAERTAAEATALRTVLEEARDELDRAIELAASVEDDDASRGDASTSPRDSADPDERLFWNSLS